MINLPLNIIMAKNRTVDSSPWLLLLTLTLPNSGTIRIVKNTEAITYKGNEYLPVDFSVSASSHSNEGSLPTLNISLSNITKLLQYYLEEYEGLKGTEVLIEVVYAGDLSEDYTALSQNYVVTSASADDHTATLNMSIPNLLTKRIPNDVYLAYNCRFKFKSPECGYSGGLTSCNKTITDCTNHANSQRFGGFLGLDNSGYRFI